MRMPGIFKVKYISLSFWSPVVLTADTATLRGRKAYTDLYTRCHESRDCRSGVGGHVYNPHDCQQGFNLSGDSDSNRC